MTISVASVAVTVGINTRNADKTAADFPANILAGEPITTFIKDESKPFIEDVVGKLYNSVSRDINTSGFSYQQENISIISYANTQQLTVNIPVDMPPIHTTDLSEMDLFGSNVTADIKVAKLKNLPTNGQTAITPFTYFDGTTTGTAQQGTATITAYGSADIVSDGKFDNSSFDAKTSYSHYFRISSDFWPSDTTNLTFNFWHKVTDNTVHSDATNNNAIVINMNRTNSVYNLWNKGTNYYQAAGFGGTSWTDQPLHSGYSSVTMSDWNMLTATKSGTTWTWYVNGTQVFTASQTVTDAQLFGELGFGSYADVGGNTNNHYSRGYWDDIALYDTVLTTSEISDLYSNGTQSYAAQSSFEPDFINSPLTGNFAPPVIEHEINKITLTTTRTKNVSSTVPNSIGILSKDTVPVLVEDVISKYVQKVELNRAGIAPTEAFSDTFKLVIKNLADVGYFDDDGYKFFDQLTEANDPRESSDDTGTGSSGPTQNKQVWIG